ncbi:hypothetical protein, partial [Candidatus Methanoperedens nitratireducens]|uniref:hypothetical protein n=1 Tax=Candidatus Methanoperedens nitratireducens TaxID=1392998 RepID=UPI00117869E4
MACHESLNLLEKILNALQILTGEKESVERQQIYNFGVWTAKRKGKNVSYEYSAAYAGTTTDLIIDFPKTSQINRIEQMWNDATAKDFDLRTYREGNSAYYTSLNTKAANVDTSIINQLGAEYKYPAGA